ncbi:chemotaxis protein CheW [Paracoccus sulfuroxidans]|uniref:Purine-binding chemotaxis protein CheW n=1 Tax=Paracoccus sulfuroxidans TaxID=384678 RepID=A0A562P1D1_9RHOB|nr:chemotaxis protein CheW [Paracoccus sulfuroxidans]TWI38133.1 purine-binding chemotaxis protein CheW [Paracoccus sulfuroxidans]
MNDDTRQRNSDEAELLAFRLGDQEFCLDIMSVREIRGWTKATPLPFTPDYVKGVINLRGTVLPVLDLSVRLGMEPAERNELNVIIVVSVNNQTSGLLVDAVSDILTLSAKDLQTPPGIGQDRITSCIKALTLFENRLIRVLDLSQVLPGNMAEVA